MPFRHQSPRQVVSIPLRMIDQQYGSDNYDNAGDDVVHCLRRVSDTSAVLEYSFSFCAQHPNPWYHTMDVVIDGISEPVYSRLIDLLAEHGLSEG